MEYLMTYGWAILIIAVVLGALFQLGVFNSSSFSPRAPPGACQVFRPGGPLTTTNINLMGVCTGQLPQYVAQFNGASGYVSMPNVNVLAGYNAGTFSTWFKGTRRGMLYGLSKGSTSTDFVYVFVGDGTSAYTDESTYFYLRRGGVTYLSMFVRRGHTFYLDNNWHHIVVATGSGIDSIYIDGVSQTITYGTGSSATNEFSNINGQDSARIGDERDGGAEGNFFNGSISNVQIYNTSLSANQIQALYLEGIGGAPLKLQNLMGWWPLNGNANDYSGNNNNGIPTAVTFTSQYGK